MDIRKTTDALHELVLLNNDRTKWYTEAMKSVRDKEPALADLFRDFAEESDINAVELDEKIKLLGSADGIEQTTISGKLFKLWSDTKAALAGDPVESLLASSEQLEDKVQQAYLQMMGDSQYMDEDSIQLLEQHQAALKESHDIVKEYRDLQRD